MPASDKLVPLEWHSGINGRHKIIQRSSELFPNLSLFSKKELSHIFHFQAVFLKKSKILQALLLVTIRMTLLPSDLKD